MSGIDLVEVEKLHQITSSETHPIAPHLRLVPFSRILHPKSSPSFDCYVAIVAAVVVAAAAVRFIVAIAVVSPLLIVDSSSSPPMPSSSSRSPSLPLPSPSLLLYLTPALSKF
jgi:hypothetical protein